MPPKYTASLTAAPGERGMTITELLVAMGLTSVIAVLLLSVAQTQTSLTAQAQSSQGMQANASAAIEEISSQVRETGRTLLQGFAYNMIPPQNPLRYPTLQVVNDSLGTGSGDSPDSLVLLITDTSQIWTTLAAGDLLKNPFVVEGLPGLEQGTYVIISSFEDGKGGLYQIKRPPAPLNLFGTPALNLEMDLIGVNPDPSMDLGHGAVLTRARFVRYRIDTDVLGGLPALVMEEGFPFAPEAPQVIAEGVEDLQIAAGVDGLWTGVPDRRLDEVGHAANDDEWVYNVAGEVMPALPGAAAITALRLTLIVRANYPEQSSSAGAGRPAAEDRPRGAGDGFRRRVLTTRIGVRPMIMN